VREKGSFDAEEIKEVQLIENIQREALSALELKGALEYLRERGLTTQEIGEKLGKGEGYVRQIFSSINTIRENPEIEALMKSDAGVTLADIQEIRPLPPKSQVDLIREKAEGKIKSRAELRERVTQLKEQLYQDYRNKRAETQNAPRPLVRDQEDGGFKLRLAYSPRKTSPEEVKQIVATFRELITRMEGATP
jgi:ParB-like chromosome segregation protein Spo0J